MSKVVPPRRNLPPDAESWGRYVEKSLDEIYRHVGVARTNLRNVTGQSALAVRGASSAQSEAERARDEAARADIEAGRKSATKWAAKPPSNPNHMDQWFDITQGNMLHLWVNYGPVVRRNFAPNPTFQLGVDSWTLSGGTLTWTNGVARIESGSTTGAAVLVSDDVPVSDGLSWSASAKVDIHGHGSPEIRVVDSEDTIVALGSRVTEGRVTSTASVDTTAVGSVRVEITLPGGGVISNVDEVLLEAAASVQGPYFDATMPGIDSEGLWDGVPRWTPAQDLAALEEALEHADEVLEQARGELTAVREELEGNLSDLDEELHGEGGLTDRLNETAELIDEVFDLAGEIGDKGEVFYQPDPPDVGTIGKALWATPDGRVYVRTA